MANLWDDLPILKAGEDSPEAEGPSKTESFLRGAGQGATAGFSDEGIGGAEALFHKYIKNDPRALAELYRQFRDEERAKNDAAQKENPLTYGAGGLAGAAASTLATGGLGEAAGGLAGAAKGAAAFGAANGLGESTADLTKGDIGGAARDTAIGGAAGGVLGAAAHGAGTLVGKAASAIKGNPELQHATEDAGLKGLGLTPGHIDDIRRQGPDAAATVLKAAEDAGALKPGSSVIGNKIKFDKARLEAAKGVQGALQDADQGGATANLSEFGRELEAKKATLMGTPGANTPGAVAAYDDAIKQVKMVENARNPPRPATQEEVSAQLKAGASPAQVKSMVAPDTMILPSEMAKVKQGAQDAANVSYKAQKGSVEGAALEDIAAAARAHAIKAAGPEYEKALQKSAAHEIAGNAIARDANIKSAQSPMGVLGMAPVAAGLLHGGPVGMAIAGGGAIATKQAKQRAASTGYALMKAATGDGGDTVTGKLARVLTTNPAVLGRYAGILGQSLQAGGEEKLNQTHYVLSQTDPQYRKTVQQIHDLPEGELQPADDATSE